MLSVKVLFWPKNATFLQKNADISKIKMALLLKGIFSETAYECVLTACVNEAVASEIFLGSLKCANVSSIHKKDNPFDKKNYRAVSILPLVSKVYERVIYGQTSDYFEPSYNEILCGFRKGHSIQHALFKLLASRQKFLDKGGFVGSILMELSKAYGCLSHDLLLTKL